MKILALGDPHGILPKNINNLIKKNKIELIISIGELFKIFRKGHVGRADIKSGERTLEKICSFGLPVIIFKGNMFDSKDGRPLWKEFLEKYKKRYPKLCYMKMGKIKIKDKVFVIFDMIYEEHSHYWLEDKSLFNKRENLNRLGKLNRLLRENKNAIFLSHAPPYGILDKITSGKRVGSKIVLEAIKKNRPNLVLCGHIHEAKGKEKFGKTLIYNLGSEGDYKIFDI